MTALNLPVDNYPFSNTMGGRLTSQNRLSDARYWADKLAALGYAVDGNPQVGDIAHWNSSDGLSTTGHVAYVTSVNPNGSVNIEDYNVNACAWRYQPNIRAPRYIHFRTSGLVQPTGSSTVYWRQRSRVYGVVSGSVLDAMQNGNILGWNWNAIRAVPNLNGLAQGPSFIAANTGSNGLLIRQKGTSGVFLMQNGRGRPFTSGEALSWNGQNWFGEVIDVASSILTSYTSGQGEPIYEVGEGDAAGKQAYKDAYARVQSTCGTTTTPGWPGSFATCLEFPQSAVQPSATSGASGIAGDYQNFGNESVRHGGLVQSARGTYAVWGAIYTHWQGLGYSGSWLGFPTRDEYQWGSNRRSDFEAGYIYWNPATNQTTAVRTSTPAPVVITNVGANVTFPVPVGTPVRWTATASGGVAPLQYRFWLHSSRQGTWSILRDWNTSNFTDWTPSESGSYLVQVWVRGAGSTATYDAWVNAGPVSVTGTAPSLTSLTANAAFPIDAGQPVTFTAQAQGGVSPLSYKFWLQNTATGQWSVLRDYAPDNSAVWTPGAPGTFSLQVWVRSAGSSAAWEDWRALPSLAVSGGPLRVTDVAFNVTGNVRAGTPVTVWASSTGGTAPVQYRFWVYDSCAGQWALIRDYAPTPDAVWTPNVSCTYWVQVWVRSAGSTAAYDAWRNSAAIIVTNSDATITAFSLAAFPVRSGVAVRVTATASGGAAPLRYRFWAFNADAGVWSIIRDYTTSNTVDWVPPAPGRYWLQVWVQNAGSTAAYDVWRNSDPFVVTP